MNGRLSFYLLGYKSRVVSLVLVTAALGFFLGRGGFGDYAHFTVLMVGTLFSCSGASVLNQVIERDSDARMARTRKRPVASGEIPAGEALAGGILLVLGGVAMLAVILN